MHIYSDRAAAPFVVRVVPSGSTSYFTAVVETVEGENARMFIFNKGLFHIAPKPVTCLYHAILPLSRRKPYLPPSFAMAQHHEKLAKCHGHGSSPTTPLIVPQNKNCACASINKKNQHAIACDVPGTRLCSLVTAPMRAA